MLSFILYISYIIFVYIKYKPSCISETYYKVGNWFTYWIIAVAFLLFPCWVEISPEDFQFLPFLSVISLGLVGINPLYLESQKRVHIISAAIAAILSLIWSLVVGQYIIPLILFIIAASILKIKNSLFWIENLSFLNIYLSIMSQYFHSS